MFTLPITNLAYIGRWDEENFQTYVKYNLLIMPFKPLIFVQSRPANEVQVNTDLLFLNTIVWSDLKTFCMTNYFLDLLWHDELIGRPTSLQQLTFTIEKKERAGSAFRSRDVWNEWYFAIFKSVTTGEWKRTLTILFWNGDLFTIIFNHKLVARRLLSLSMFVCGLHASNTSRSGSSYETNQVVAP